MYQMYIIRSFHDDMEERIILDQTLLEKINVNYGLHQGCTMAPTPLNLYACVVMERWLESEGDRRSWYMCVVQLFSRSTREASSNSITECWFADDVILLASTREAAEVASYQSLPVSSKVLRVNC